MEPAGGPMGVLEKSSKVKSVDTNLPYGHDGTNDTNFVCGNVNFMSDHPNNFADPWTLRKPWGE